LVRNYPLCLDEYSICWVLQAWFSFYLGSGWVYFLLLASYFYYCEILLAHLHITREFQRICYLLFVPFWCLSYSFSSLFAYYLLYIHTIFRYNSTLPKGGGMVSLRDAAQHDMKHEKQRKIWPKCPYNSHSVIDCPVISKTIMEI
jgi:hypothetical protein